MKYSITTCAAFIVAILIVFCLGAATTTIDLSPENERDLFATHVDVAAYAPLEQFKRQHDKEPTVNELATFISHIRYAEADAMIARKAATRSFKEN